VARAERCLAVFCESFCSSAAEEEEYEAFHDSRQPLFCYTAELCGSCCQRNTLISWSFSTGGEL
jgi:hypothetical protein